MCLAVPGRVVAWIEQEAPFARAQVAFGGVSREVSMQCVPEAAVGDYVLVHAGLAIARIDAAEADRLLTTLAELDALDDHHEPPPEEPPASSPNARAPG
jgi:hydrogenase expression/formation protein HypC